MPPTYRQRLRLEGLALAGAGTLGSLMLLVLTVRAQRGLAGTAAQLAGVALLLAWLGPRSVRRAIAASQPRARGELGSGEPTPLWQLPLIVAALALAAGLLAGWDAGLRVTTGCLLVGLAQSLVLERMVAGAERAGGRIYFRVAGSRIVLGTRLAYIEA